MNNKRKRVRLFTFIMLSTLLLYGLYLFGSESVYKKIVNDVIKELESSGKDVEVDKLDYPNVQAALNDSLGKSLRIPSGYKLYIEVPSTNYPNLQSAIDDMKLKDVERGSNIEIRLKPGFYYYDEQVIADGLNTPFLDIKGEENIKVTTTGVASIKSDTFNIEYYSNDFKDLYYHKVTYNVSSVTGIETGQFVIIKETAGEENHYYHQGVWEIIGVDKEKNEITVLHTGNAKPPKDITASMVIPTTIIHWNKNTTAFLADRNTSLGTIDNVVFVGTGRPEKDEISGRSVSGWDMVGGKGGVTGVISRDSSTLSLGPNFAISSFSGSNVYATQSAQIDANGSVSSSAARVGLGAASGASIQVSGSIASGNLLDGILAQDNSFSFAKSSISCGNHRHGFISSGNANVNSDNAVAIGNKNTGAVSTGSLLSANGLISNNNGENGLWVYNGGRSRAVGIKVKNNKKYGIIAQTGSHISASNADTSENQIKDIYANDMSNILVTGYMGNPSFFPELNTLQSDGSFIKSGDSTSLEQTHSLPQ